MGLDLAEISPITPAKNRVPQKNVVGLFDFELTIPVEIFRNSGEILQMFQKAPEIKTTEEKISGEIISGDENLHSFNITSE